MCTFFLFFLVNQAKPAMFFDLNDLLHDWQEVWALQVEV
jgi:hypothetical protein